MRHEIDIFTDDSIRMAVALDGWILDIARDKWAANVEMSMDEMFKVNIEFIAKHWHLKPHEVTFADLQFIKRKVCQLFDIHDSLSKMALDWSYNEDKNDRYKFSIDSKKHALKAGMRLSLSVWGRPDSQQLTATIIEVLPDGIVVQADGYVDTSEEYNFKKI